MYVAVERLIAAGRVLYSIVVGIKGLIAAGRIVEAGGIGEQRLIAVSRIVRAGGVVEERLRSARAVVAPAWRIAATDGVITGIERLVSAGRIVISAAGIIECLVATGGIAGASKVEGEGPIPIRRVVAAVVQHQRSTAARRVVAATA